MVRAEVKEKPRRDLADREELVSCRPCRKSCRRRNLLRHEKTKKHEEFIDFRASIDNISVYKAKIQTNYEIKHRSLYIPSHLVTGFFNRHLNFIINTIEDNSEIANQREEPDIVNLEDNNSEIAIQEEPNIINLSEEETIIQVVSESLNTAECTNIILENENRKTPEKETSATSLIDEYAKENVIQSSMVKIDADNNQGNQKKSSVLSKKAEKVKVIKNPKRTQTVFKQICQPCDRMDTLIRGCKTIVLNLSQLFKSAKNECSHNKNNVCCCERDFSSEMELDPVSEDQLENENWKKKNAVTLSKFSCNVINQKNFWFCKTCHDYTKRKTGGEYDWHTKGKYKEKPYDLINIMVKHLKSTNHALCVKSKTDKETIKKNLEFYKTQQRILTTENLCMTGQFYANHNLSQRFYPKNVHLMYLMNENLKEHKAAVFPTGNVHQTKTSIKDAQKACFKAVSRQIKTENEIPFPPTGQTNRSALACDKGTAPKDCQRQPVVSTTIDYKTGKPKETVLSAAYIPRGNAEGAFKHVTSKLENLMPLSNIAFTSTDNEAVYVGDNSGMIQRMKCDDRFSKKLNHLQDTCHNIEKVVCPPEKKYEEHLKSEGWVRDTLSTSKQVIGSALTHPKLIKILREYAESKVEANVFLHPFKAFMTVRFSEYSSNALNSILKNLNVMTKFLPEIASGLDKEYDCATKETASQMLQTICNPLFIARVVLIDTVLYPISVLEKTAQASDYGPFDYIRTKNKLKKSLGDAKNNEYVKDKIKHLFEKKVLNFTYYVNKKKKKQTINFGDINIPGHNLRTNTQEIIDIDEVWSNFVKWIDNLSERLDDYMVIPECMQLAVNIFSLSESDTNLIPFEEKLKDLRKLFTIVNTEFEKCSDADCKGVEDCPELEKELYTFLNDVSLRKKNKNIKTCKEGQIVIGDFYSFYFCEDNIDVVKNLNVKNVLRALEVCLLMKASQSSTERVVSQIKRTVKIGYEGKRGLDDMVNIIVMLRMNSDINKLNTEEARKIFINEMGKTPALMKTKPSNELSKTLKTMLGYKQNNKSVNSKSTSSLHPIMLTDSPAQKLANLKQRMATKLSGYHYKQKADSNKDASLDNTSNIYEIQDFENEVSNAISVQCQNEQIDNGSQNSKDREILVQECISKEKNDNGKRKNEKQKNCDDGSSIKVRRLNKKSRSVDGNIVNISETEYKTLPLRYCIDDCLFKRQRFKKKTDGQLIGCDKDKECVSRNIAINEGFRHGDWFHDRCLGMKLTKNEAKKIDFVCSRCKEKN